MLCIMPAYAQTLTLQLTASGYHGYNINLIGAFNSSLDAAVSALHFHLNGDVEFTACPAGGNPDDDIDALMQSVMKITNDGKIGIGIEPQAGYKLTVDGKVGVREVYVRATGAWPDYVFDAGYELMTLKETGRFIKTHKHLPGMKPAAEVETEGQPLGDIQKLQQEHLEKLYLYILQLEQRIDELEKRK